MPPPTSWLVSLLPIQTGVGDLGGVALPPDGDNGTIPVPAGTAVGDLLLAFGFGMLDSNLGQNMFIDATSNGWSKDGGNFGSTSNNVVMSRWDKIATSGDLTNGFSFRAGFSSPPAGVPMYVAGVMYAVRGTTIIEDGDSFSVHNATTGTETLFDNGLVNRVYFEAGLANSVNPFTLAFTPTGATQTIDVSDSASATTQHWRLYGFRFDSLTTPTPSLAITTSAAVYYHQQGFGFGLLRRPRAWAFCAGV